VIDVPVGRISAVAVRCSPYGIIPAQANRDRHAESVSIPRYGLRPSKALSAHPDHARAEVLLDVAARLIGSS